MAHSARQYGANLDPPSSVSLNKNHPKAKTTAAPIAVVLRAEKTSSVDSQVTTDTGNKTAELWREGRLSSSTRNLPRFRVPGSHQTCAAADPTSPNAKIGAAQ
ncbi:hypothetical protein Q1695_002243 [Nippostrongylus brasiliensis]|nr:hypothetical protein Q1695_002243 [Nippostrongylus brasiliensis]